MTRPDPTRFAPTLMSRLDGAGLFERFTGPPVTALTARAIVLFDLLCPDMPWLKLGYASLRYRLAQSEPGKPDVAEFAIPALLTEQQWSHRDDRAPQTRLVPYLGPFGERGDQALLQTVHRLIKQGKLGEVLPGERLEWEAESRAEFEAARRRLADFTRLNEQARAIYDQLCLEHATPHPRLLRQGPRL